MIIIDCIDTFKKYNWIKSIYFMIVSLAGGIIAALFLILSFTQAYIIKQEFGGGTFENVSQNEELDKSEPENPVAPTG